jgi:hypothetical protein
MIRGSALASCIAATVWIVSFAPASHRLAYAQDAAYYNYYNDYGLGLKGGYIQNFGGTNIFVPNWYYGFGVGPSNYDPRNGNTTGHVFGPSNYRGSPSSSYFRGF